MNRLIYITVISFFLIISPVLSAQDDTASDNLIHQIHTLNGLQKAIKLEELAKKKWDQNPDTSIILGYEIIDIADKIEDDTILVKGYNILGISNYNLDKPYEALTFFETGLDISQKAAYQKGIGTLSNNIGLTYDYLGNYNLAAHYYYEALKSDQSVQNEEGVAAVYLNLGNIFYYMGNFDKALEYMTNSLNIYQKLEDQTGILNCYTNIGITYSKINVEASALDYLGKAFELSKELGNRDMEAANLNNIGEVYYHAGDYFKALDHYNRALEIEKTINDAWSEANTLRNIGSVYLQIEIPNEAKNHFERSMQIARKINAHQLLTDLYLDFSYLYESQGNYTRALEYYKEYVHVKDSVFNSKNLKQITEVEARYKIQNKSQDIQILKRENEMKSLQIKTQNYFLIISIAVSLLILSLLVIFYYRSRINRREKQIQQEKNLEVTKQKKLLERAVHKLKESQRVYKSLIESIQDALVIVQNKKIVYANDHVAKLLGYDTPEEIKQFSFEDVISEHDLPKINENFDRRMAGEEVPENYTFHIIHKSGTPRLVNLNVKLTTYKGKPGVLATLKDITELKEYEEKLISEKERAQRATHSKSMFVAGISHEIRNHMHSIIGISEILGDTKLDEEQKEFVDVIKLSGNNLLDIINEVLDLSKIESGQIDLEEKPINLKKIIHEVVSLNNLKAKEKALDLNTAIATDIPEEVMGDAMRISQILINFVTNAIKFTDQGSISIGVEHVKDVAVEDGISLLKFKVTDTGIGISEDSQRKLFKPFSQTHAAVERNVGGSGLGLAICKKLAELMGGEIGIESEVGKGSTFWFTAQFSLSASTSKKVKKSLIRAIHHKKILLVEDNLLNQQLTTSILRKEGYKMDVGENGQLGFELYKKNDYGLVLMDIQMPVMDGLEAARMIRDYEKNNNKPKTTIIAVTAHSKDLEEQKMMEAGIDEYLQKPFTPAELVNLVKKQSHS
ncbi:MAG: tetratricopeptide repeat protein [Bacteroidetes bacterium]|nr:tetratricopeptide repeat protein [Bacteroidota bacterium]